MSQENTQNGTSTFLAGVLVGSLVGAVTTLLIAPQSGKQTREELARRGIALRDEVSETADQAVAQARKTGKQVSSDVQEKVVELKRRGQEMVDEGRDNLSALLTKANHEVKSSS